MDSILGDSNSLWGLLGTVGLTLLTYAANRYVIPWLKVGHREQYARYVAAIADDLTDELRLKYPDKVWLKHLDEAVDALIQVCGISREVALRALQAAAARK